MSHNGIDIDQYILLIIYPSIAFFLIGFITKKKNVRKSITYIIQSVICFSFSIAYYLFVPHGGAQGLSLILGLFGVLLLVLARKERVNPAEEDGEEEDEENVQKKNNG
jgi:L-lactate permease